jgi:hypothetical protein
LESRVRGEFEVKLTPRDGAADGLGRMGIEKKYSGPLDASACGEMLTASTVVDGSAGYVAVERVDGSLEGREGTFVLQHSATLTRGAPQLSIGVVPDSGTGELVGLVGRMKIEITGGKHFYVLEYTIPRYGRDEDEEGEEEADEAEEVV